MKHYEITDPATGHFFGSLSRVSSRRLARKVAQKRADELRREISLHEVIRGRRNLLDRYQPTEERQ